MRHMYLLLKLSLFILLSVSSLFAVSNSCNGTLATPVHNATGDASYSDSENDTGGGGYSAYYRFRTQIDGTARIRIDNMANNRQRIYIGTSCKDDDLYYVQTKTGMDKTFNITAGQYYYIRIRERNSANRIRYRIRIDFTAANTGCDNSLDTSANDNYPGVAVPALDGTASNASTCLSGSSENDDEEYYYFTVNANGTLDITTSSPNGHDNHFEVESSVQGTLHSYDTDQDRSLSYNISSGERIVFLFKETGDDKDWWQINLNFTVSGTPPVFNGPIPDQSATQNQSYSLNTANYFQETEGDTITYSTSSSLPSGISLSSAGVLSGTPTSTGNYTVIIKATDKDGTTNSNSFTFSVVGAEVPPVMNNIPDQSATVGTAYSLDLSSYVQQTNGDAITQYNLTCLPNGLSFNQSTGLLDGTPTATGSYSCSATAEDNDGLSNSVNFNFTVTDPYASCTDTLDTGSNDNTNDSYPGVVVPGLDGATADITRCLLGESENSDKDYYNFTIGTEGNLTITTSSPNGHDNHFQVWINNNEVYSYDTGQNRQMKFPLRQNDKVTVLFKETGDDLDKYKIIFDFVAGSIGDILLGGDRPFTVRNPDYTRNITGNYAIIGNANQCALYSTDTNPPWTGACYQSYSNSRPSRYIDVDGNATTVNSSTSTLAIPNFTLHNAKVVWAGLYWQGVVHNSNKSGDFMGTSGQANGITISGEPKYSTDTQIDFSQSSSTYDAEYVKFKVPGGNYVRVKADVFDFYKLGYAGFKEVTSMLNVNNPNGVYAVADIKSNQGVEDHHGNYASWALVVIYEDPREKFRNITLFDGYVTIDSGYNEDLVMDGFLTPRVGPIRSKLAMFAMDGDNGSNSLKIINQAGEVTEVQNQDNPSNSLFDSTISSNITRNPDSTSLRTDLKVLELVDVLNPLETKATLRPRTGGDRYTPSFFIMSAELIKPDLCYDYAYQQNGRYFTEENDGSRDPHITGSLFSSSPITVSLFIKNRENSDFTISNLKTSISPIDTTQATYVNNSVKVILPGETARHSVTPQSSGPDHLTGVPIGALGGKEFFYLYYDLDPQTFSINMPINAYLDYNATFTLPNGTKIDLPPYHQQVNSDIPMCVEGNFSYTPVYGTFNIEQKNLGAYNIYTQVAKRVDNFQIKSYDANNLGSPATVSTIVAVELIDAGAFHETQTSCQEPDNILTTRIWTVLDNVDKTDFTADTIQNAIDKGMVADQILHKASPISQPSDFYATIRRNSAFRVSANRINANEMIQLQPATCQGSQIAPCYEVTNFPDLNTWDVGNGAGNCVQDIDGNPSTTDKIATYCDNSTATGLGSKELATCMECIYGYNIAYICSRDNFAIRPEAFKVSIADDNTSTINEDFANNTNKAGSSSSPINLVAGYPYRFDINATSHIDQVPVSGYVQSFASGDSRKRAFMAWTPRSISASQASANCNEPKDRNMSFAIVDGTNTNPNPINTWADRHDKLDNVGEYEFKVVDEEWTKYDWEENLTRHHNASGFIGNTTPDCVRDDDTVPVITPGDNTTINSKSGCKTSSVHATIYKPLYIRSYPYSYDTTSLGYGAGPNNNRANNTFVYVNTLDLTGYNVTEDENMSYNIQGTFRAKSFDTTQRLTNFVNGCFANDVNMTLNYTYHHAAPIQQLQYDLIDFNATDSSVVYRSRENNALPADNTIKQLKGHFAKDMQGAITMDLGYNYDRQYNAPFNPIWMHVQELNISSSSQPTQLFVEGKTDHKIYGVLSIDQNVTFVYGRAKPNRYLYDDVTANSIVTPVSIVAYCDMNVTECQNRGLAVIATGMLADTKSNEEHWWFVENHDMTTGSGDLTLTASGGTVAPASPVNVSLTNGIDRTVNVTNGGTTPNVVSVDLGTETSRWIIFNKDTDTVPSPFYKVRFINSGGWTGTGKTGNVVGGTINTRKSRRLEW